MHSGICSIVTDTDGEYLSFYWNFKYGVSHQHDTIVSKVITLYAMNDWGTVQVVGGTAPYHACVQVFN